MILDKELSCSDIHPQAGESIEQYNFTSYGDRNDLNTSVIIVNFNSRDHLVHCIASVNSTTDAEIIVVDNASSDGSADFIGSAYPEIQLIRSPTNLGFGQGNNLGVCDSHGRYLAFLNPDILVEPGWLESLLSALKANPQAGIATSKILLMDNPDTINTCGNDLHLTGLTLCRGMGLPCTAFSQPADVSAISGAAFIIHRKLFESLGGFDPNFFLYMEDTDLSLRARLAGYHCLYVPNSLVYHDYSLTFGSSKTYYQERNRYLMLLKIYKWPTLFALFPALILAELVTWGFVLLRERGNLMNKPFAYAWVIRHWQAIMYKRRHTQALRTVRDRDLLLGTTHRLDYAQTGTGFIPRLASWVFDPLFYLLRGLALVLVWW